MEEIPGLPDKNKVDKIRPVKPIKPEDWEFVLQEHNAERAGKHYDLRLEIGRAHV